MNRFLLMIILLLIPIFSGLLDQPDTGAGSTNHEKYVFEFFSFDSSNLVNEQDGNDKFIFFHAIALLVLVVMGFSLVNGFQANLQQVRHFLKVVFYQANYVKVSPLND